MAILNVERVVSSTAPSFTASAANTVTDIGYCNMLATTSFQLELPKTVYTAMAVQTADAGFSITNTGLLSIDCNNAAITPLAEATVRNFTIRIYNGANYIDKYYTVKLNYRAPGAMIYDSPGTYTFVVPAGVTKISAVAVGGGGGGGASWAQSAGSGGSLAYANNITVTPGQSITVTVGTGGWGAHYSSTGGGTSSVGSFFSASGGSYSGGLGAGPISGTVTAVGGQGGSSRGSYGGGGGAGGYAGSGGTGGYGNDQTDGAGGGGGGGGGYASSTYSFGGGGGVGLYGQGANGVRGDYNNGNTFYSDNRYSGKGGSGGINGYPNDNGTFSGTGGKFGGGGAGGGTSMNASANQCKGGDGGVRIIWGTNRNFPFNAA